MTWLRHGGMGLWLAAVMLAAALLLVLLAIPSWQRDAELAARQSRELGRALASVRRPSAPATSSAAAASTPLPSADAARERLASLLQLARQHGLVVTRTQQRLVSEAQRGHAHWAVQMPARAGYAQLRGFMDAALRADPALALESLRLQRESPGDAELSADMGWSLYHRRTEREEGS